MIYKLKKNMISHNNEETSEYNDKIDDKMETDTSIKEVKGDKSSIIHYWNNSLQLLCSTNEDNSSNENMENYTKGCQWSPDGTCVLVPYSDYRLRIYDLPRELYAETIPSSFSSSSPALLTPALTVKDGGLIYDACWYPWMNSWDPATCCFISTSKETPVHLWDAFTGELRATYRAYNQVDEVAAAVSVQFSIDGSTIWGGFKGVLRSFDVNRPGRQVDNITLKHSFPKMHGIVSCIRENPITPGLLALGTYSKCIGLYKDGPLCIFEAESGVTQIEFSSCGTKLYSAVRRNNEFLCWDLRNPGKILYTFEDRRSDTNQRIQFSISDDGNEIISGGTDGSIKIWKISESVNNKVTPTCSIKLSQDCVNGVNIHRTQPILASSSGQRLCDDNENIRDSSVRFWYCGS